MKQKPYWDNHFWACGYFVSTIGIDKDVIKRNLWKNNNIVLIFKAPYGGVSNPPSQMGDFYSIWNPGGAETTQYGDFRNN